MIAWESYGEGRRVEVWLRFTAGAGEDGVRLGSALRGRGASRGLLRRLKRRGEVTVNGIPVRLDHVLRQGDLVEVRGEHGGAPLPAGKAPLRVVFFDEHLLVVDKPAGVLVHPAHEKTGTLAGAAAAWLAERGVEAVPRPVNRLDRGTSGLVVFALSPVVAHRLCVLRDRGAMRREYLALVEGVPGLPRGEIGEPVLGRPALTSYRVLVRWAEAALLLVTPRTGRLHQIRVHMAGMGHPLMGDVRYGSGQGPGRSEQARPGPGRPALHAWRLTFPHPADGRTLCLRAPVPPDLRSLMRRLGPPATARQERSRG